MIFTYKRITFHICTITIDDYLQSILKSHDNDSNQSQLTNLIQRSSSRAVHSFVSHVSYQVSLDLMLSPINCILQYKVTLFISDHSSIAWYQSQDSRIYNEFVSFNGFLFPFPPIQSFLCLL